MTPVSRFASAARLARAPFLLLTLVVILLALAAAAYDGIALSPWLALLVLTGALAAHIAVNVLNEYSDFNSGLDLKTVKTPFSGGSGLLPQHPGQLGFARSLALLSLLVILLCGFLLLASGRWWLLPLGLAGLLLVLTYTPYINRNPWLCLLAPGAGFGLLMLSGAYYSFALGFSPLALICALPVFFLVNNLLLLNQFPDVEADASVGRRHLPIVIGRQRSVQVYALGVALAYLSVLAGWALQWLPSLALLACLSLPLALLVIHGVRQDHSEMAKLPRLMGLNVALTLLTPGLLALGLWLATPA